MNETLRPEQIRAQAQENLEAFRQINYRGRCLVDGTNDDGSLGVQIYSLEGRSENSRNRIFERVGNKIRTAAFDPTKLKDPSLVIYTAMDQVGNVHIVSNGDQTDTISEQLQRGNSFKSALKTRTYEPDDPNFTNRISAASVFKRGFGSGQFSIIFRGEDGEPVRKFSTPLRFKGLGSCIHTYEGDGNPLPAFKRDPYFLPLRGGIEQMLRAYWDSLDRDFRVAAVIKVIDKNNGEVNFRTIDIHTDGIRPI